MDESKKHSESLMYVRGYRVSTKDLTKRPIDENVCVINEAPVTIDVEGIETYTILCTPIDKKAMAVGFLFTEGVIDNFADIDTLKLCDNDPDTIRVRLKGETPRIADAGRNLLIVSSCGACGSENLSKRIAALPSVSNSLTIEAGILRLLDSEIRKRQSLFQASGGAHAAAIFNSDGKIISFAEDSGRHNALDKAIGKCVMGDINTAGMGVALTSRLSLEMVSRCTRAGLELIAAMSAPTSMAIDVADKCNITLCAFVRQTRATVFTHPYRVIKQNE